MRKIFTLALANIRKSKSQSVSFLIISLIAALLLNLGLITWGDYARSFDEKAKLLNAPDLVWIAQNSAPTFVSAFGRSLQQDSRIAQATTRPALIAGSEFQYTEGINSRQAAFFDRSVGSDMGGFTMVEQTADPVQNPIYLPYLFQSGGGYQLGDSFVITLYTATTSKRAYSYTVAGFYEDIFFSTLNSTITGYLLDHEQYTALEQSFGGGASGALFSAQTKNPAENEGIVSQYRTLLEEQCPAGTMTDSNHYATLKSARTVTSSIGSSIILGFSLVLLLVSLVVVNFRIRNSVEEEIRNIGALKALGYTSRQLICAFLLQFLILALAGGILGIVCAQTTLPALGAMFAAQTGIWWQPQFSLSAACVTILFVLALVGTVAFFSAVRIRKLPPIVALRTGLLTHSFRRNPFPLHRGRGPLSLRMAGKQLARNMRQNILIGLIVAGVTFSAVFAGVLYYNINIESSVFIRMVAGETPHAQIAVSAENAPGLLKKIKGMEETDRAFYFDTDTVRCETQFEAYAHILDEFAATGNADWLYAGRFPRYDNEVAIGGLLAQSLNKEIGDTVRLSKGDAEREFLITGFIQGSNYMGHDLCISQAAYRGINEDFSPTVISIYLKDQAQTADFLDTLERDAQGILSAINTDEIIRSSMSTYQGIVAILAAVISVVTMVIVALVLFLVIKTLLIRKKLELGIEKAIGFTTRQLALQNALAFLPVIFLGALLGCIGGYFGLNPFFSMLFSGIGIMKVSFVLYLPMLAAICVGIVLLGFIVSVLISLRIKRITPRALMSE